MKSHFVSTGMDQKGFKWLGSDTVDETTQRLHESMIGPPNFKSIWWLEERSGFETYVTCCTNNRRLQDKDCE